MLELCGRKCASQTVWNQCRNAKIILLNYSTWTTMAIYEGTGNRKELKKRLDFQDGSDLFRNDMKIERNNLCQKGVSISIQLKKIPFSQCQLMECRIVCASDWVKSQTTANTPRLNFELLFSWTSVLECYDARAEGLQWKKRQIQNRAIRWGSVKGGTVTECIVLYGDDICARPCKWDSVLCGVMECNKYPISISVYCIRFSCELAIS